MHRTRRTAIGAAILAVVACSVYDPTILVGGTPGSGNTGASGGKGGKSGAAGGSGVGGVQPAGGVGGRGVAGSSVGGTGVAGTSAPAGGAGGTAGMENLGGQGAEGGQAGMGDGGEDMGGSGGDAGTGGASGRGGGSGMSGAGGTAGTGGSGGQAGTSGAGGVTGGAGSGGTAGGGGSGGSVTVANGCARLDVPLDDTGDRAHFVISLSSAINMSAATISLRVYAASASGGSIFSYVQDGESTVHFFGPPAGSRPAFTAGWQTVTWNVGTEPPGSTGIVKTNIRRIGIEVNAAPATVWATPSTILFVDSVTVATPAQTFTFGTTDTVTTTPSNGLDVAGQVLWLSSATSDTTATGVALSWVATCP